MAVRNNNVKEDDKDRYLALKKIEKVFEHKIWAIRTLRELKILRLLKHENVLFNKKFIINFLILRLYQ